MSNGSFSKYIAPGLRCGWVEGKARAILYLSQHAAIRSGGAPSQLTAYAVSEFLDSDQCDKHLQTLRDVYSQRAEAYYTYMEKYLFPLGFTAKRPFGGYFIWVTLPLKLKMNADEFAAYVHKNHDVRIFPGNLCEVRRNDATSHTWSNAIRVSVSYIELDEGLLGLQHICAAFRNIEMLS